MHSDGMLLLLIFAFLVLISDTRVSFFVGFVLAVAFVGIATLRFRARKERRGIR